MNQIIKAGALVCALAMLEWNPAAVAEEKRLGDYIYVPAMSNPAGMGAISLRVEGVKSGENGEKETVEALAGAEFGVYVYSSEGKLTPWANPLLPSEPMRIRTGETETRFSLPQGTEFYLRQERAPEGYTFDSQTLIPARERTSVDWQSVNRLVEENRDFKEFVELVGEYHQTGKIHKSLWNK